MLATTRFCRIATRGRISSSAKTFATPKNRVTTPVAAATVGSRSHSTKLVTRPVVFGRTKDVQNRATNFMKYRSWSNSVASMNNQSTSVETTRPEVRPCWKCGSPLPFLSLKCIQSTCAAVQPVAPGATHFELLGLGSVPTFDIDTKDLRTRFFKIQQQVHPDSFSQNVNGDQVYAQQQSTHINKAYSVLKDPLPRANYMLELLNHPINETEKLNEQELLMQVMEVREQLEEAETEKQVQEIKDENDARMSTAEADLSQAFKSNDIEAARALAIQMQYWVRIQNVIRDWVAGGNIVADHV